MLKLHKKMRYYLLSHIWVYGNYTQTFVFFWTPKMSLFLGILDKKVQSLPFDKCGLEIYWPRPTGWKKNTLVPPIHYQKKNFFGNFFYEFKLWFIPEVTLHPKTSFGKKRTFQPHPWILEDAYTIAKKNSKGQQV